jgi:hypothetical protein
MGMCLRLLRCAASPVARNGRERAKIVEALEELRQLE